MLARSQRYRSDSRFLLLVTLTAILFTAPTFAHAAWWNPFSWFKSAPEQTAEVSTDSQDALVERIEELEQLLHNTSLSEASAKGNVSKGTTTRANVPPPSPTLTPEEEAEVESAVTPEIVEKPIYITNETVKYQDTPETLQKLADYEEALAIYKEQLQALEEKYARCNRDVAEKKDEIQNLERALGQQQDAEKQAAEVIEEKTRILNDIEEVVEGWFGGDGETVVGQGLSVNKCEATISEVRLLEEKIFLIDKQSISRSVSCTKDSAVEYYKYIGIVKDSL